ncbi:YegS/Rv2252/BmrU family lipid kinase [Sedimentibacter sp. zth1]|uniref:diacylglycerol/lipid kinase family protein n=1 Tax=Sedimentibacter sp. zth1 TaxID=2816908 RepID=UPI001A921B26|nr:YegS/Rv2252/BmrU family lipid kinase [Sedimentibacter sp. zth1]QSX04951.1 YegS/Rv2252/BmrU family lipid kinase [Sedimentibacter sp. zth1]
MKRYKVIYNPTSGKEEAAIKAFQMSRVIMESEDIEFTFYATKCKNDAMTKAKEACNEGYDMIISCGGDGTVHEVVNGIMQSENKTKLAIMASGTVNDFAEQLKIPRTYDKFAAMVKNAKSKKVDIGKINDEYFVNVVCGGSFTNIPHTVTIEEKTLFGRYAYYFHALFELPEQLNKTYKIKYTVDEKVFEMNSHLFIINNTLGAGGFKYLCPDAKVDDGLLDLVIFEKATHAELIQIFTKLFNGQHIKHNKVHYFQAKNIIIESEDDSLVVDSDGELAGKMPIYVTSDNKGLNIIIP